MLLSGKSIPHRHSFLIQKHLYVLPFIMFENDASFLCPSFGLLHSELEWAQTPWVQQYFLGPFSRFFCLVSVEVVVSELGVALVEERSALSSFTSLIKSWMMGSWEVVARLTCGVGAGSAGLVLASQALAGGGTSGYRVATLRAWLV